MMAIHIRFEVTFEDGTVEHFFIDRYTLSRGDHVVGLIAGERQREGKLPSKPIKSIVRAPAD